MGDVQKMADAVFASVKGYVASALQPFADRLKALEDRQPEKGEKGDPGVDGRDGTSVTAEDVAPLVSEEVAKAVGALPPAEKGVPGERGEKGDAGDKGDPGKDGIDGKSFTLDEVRALVREAVEAEQAKWALEFERHAQGVLERAVDRMPKPKDGIDGKDGLGFDDLQMDYDGERRFTFSYTQGDKDKAFSFAVPMLLDRGVFKETSEYERGDVVTWAGAMWIAQKDAPEGKPGLSADWRLSVKKGRDGRDSK